MKAETKSTAKQKEKAVIVTVGEIGKETWDITDKAEEMESLVSSSGVKAGIFRGVSLGPTPGVFV